MTIESDPELMAQTPWFIGAATAMFAATVGSMLSTIIGLFWFLVPGNAIDGQSSLDMAQMLVSDSWPFLLMYVVLAAASVGYLNSVHLRAKTLPWGPILLKAAVMLIPATIVLTGLSQVLGGVRYGRW